LAGKQVRCNQCGEVLKVPEAKISDDEPLPADADRDQTTKRCPACKREIVKEAATCYHCGQTIENS
jgi:primosomal protein N'